MSVATKTNKPHFDKQDDRTDEERVEAAIQTFIQDFGATAALYMESCVSCGMCAEACQFYVTTDDPKYTPIYKIKPFKQAYKRHIGPFAPIYRVLNLTPKVDIKELEDWQELLYDSCTMCGRCSTICPMGIDIADLIKQARHGMYKAGLMPERMDLMGRTTKLWGSPATPIEDFAEILEEDIQDVYGEPLVIDKEKADILVTLAPAELGDHTKAVADIAKILNHIGADWTFRSDGFEASNIGYINGDIELQEKLTMQLVDTAIKIGAKTLILPECGHAYSALRWEASRWYGKPLPFRVIHMTEFLAEVLNEGKIKVKKIDATASFHDPCQLVRRGGVVEPPRDIVKALGYDLIEMEDSGNFGWCCGGGGGVISNTRANPLRFKVFEMKKEQFEETGAEHFLTSCGQCRITLTGGAKKFNWDKKIESLLELVADNMIEDDASSEDSKETTKENTKEEA